MHITDRARLRDPVTARHDEPIDQRHTALFEVHTDPSHLSDVAAATVGTIVSADPGIAEREVPVVISRQSLLHKDGLAQVHDRIESVEALLFAYMFPHHNGFFTRVFGSSMNTYEYLRFRARQAFTPFTKHAEYLLLMRSIENCRSVVANCVGKFAVNRQAYKAAEAELPNTASQGEILDRVIKHRVPDCVDGSPAYFKRGKRNLDAMVRELGLPSHFVTITMNETGIERSQEYACLDDCMKAWNAAFDWRDAPVECNRAFIARFNHVLNQDILSPDGPQLLGAVSDYAIRFECQGRGSLHVHMCIWLSAADATALDHRIIACVPADFDTDSETFIAPADPLQRRLFRHAVRKQQHVCSVSRCLEDGKCKLHFPQPLHASYTPALRQGLRRYMYLCPRACDARTVPWLPELALRFDAHVNIVKIVAEDWSIYLLKYATKPDPAGDLRLTDHQILSMGFGSVNMYLQAVAARFASTTVYQASQLALVATDTPTFRTSRDVAFIDVRPPEERTRLVNSQNKFATPCADAQRAYESRPDMATTPPWDANPGVIINVHALACCAFHRRIETLTRSQLSRHAEVSPVLWKSAQSMWNTEQGLEHAHLLCPVPRADMSVRFIGVSDTDNLAYFWRSQRQLVRFPIIDPRQSVERFAYHLLCEYIPFRSEMWFRQFFPSYAAAAVGFGIIDTMEKLSFHVSRHCKYVFASASLTPEQVVELGNKIVAAPTGPVHTFSTELDLARAADIEAGAAAQLPPALQLDEHQHHAYDVLRNEHTRGLYILTGGPGCGKSVVARLVAHARARTDGVSLMASTNEAARLLSPMADTIHSTCNVPIGGSVIPPYSIEHLHARTLTTCHTFIIDEFSQCATLTFTVMLGRIGQAQNLSLRGVLAKNLIILVGDICQLPPVCARGCPLLREICPEHNIIAHHVFKAAFLSDRRLSLYANHRNPGFAPVLEAIRNQHAVPLTQAWVDANVNTLCLGHLPTPDARMLCSHKVDVARHNDAMLAQATPNAIVAMPDLWAQPQWLGADHVRITYDALTTAERAAVDGHEANRLRRVAVGSRVRLFRNVEKRRGLVNSTTGTVVGFNYNDSADRQRLTGIRMHIDHNGRTASINRMQPVGLLAEHRHLSIAFWPLTLTYASTVHSVQGCSISSKVYIDMQSCFAPGLAYTALSRNTNRADICLLQPLTPTDLRVVNPDAFYAAQAAGEQPVRPTHNQH